MKSIAFFRLIFIIPALSSCITFAPPAPLLTYGGPKTTPNGTSEAAIAVGTGAALFDGAHTGAQGWFGRYKYGLSERTDLGIDLAGASRSDGNQYLGVKIASRYQITNQSRFELGIGAADDSDGKSLNTDVAITVGTIKEKTWNYYSSLRFSYAKGYPGNSITLPGQSKLQEDSIAPPNTVIALINLGAQGKISDVQKFIIEGGYGYIFPQGEKKGPTFYLSIGLLFNFGKFKEGD